MLQFLSEYDGSAAARARLLTELNQRLIDAQASKGRGDMAQVARAEAAVKAAPRRCIRINSDGNATVYAAGRSYAGGHFSTPRLCELRAKALLSRERQGRPACRAALWILDGASPLTDIGTLQANAAPRSLFQVASQWNCLESPGRYIAEVAEYVNDPTQGPRASISAFPGTLVRHYAAPGLDGNRYVQSSDGPQVNLLSDLLDTSDSPIARVHNGYLRTPEVYDAPAFARLLEDQFESIRVGLHDGVEVVLGHDWDGAVAGAPFRTISQVFTSTLAAGMYGELDVENQAFATICQELQRAAYLGTLLGAAALGMERVVLTLIGGGVFANPLPVIWDAILWAFDRLPPLLHRDLVVVVNGRNLSEQIAPALLRSAAQRRGGALIRCERGSPPSISDAP